MKGGESKFTKDHALFGVKSKGYPLWRTSKKRLQQSYYIHIRSEKFR